MNRHRAIEVIMKQVKDEIVISNIGDPSKELYHVKDRSRNFYMLGSMGLASSISLGIALSTNEKVVCLEGDGALLMNLGSLATIANHNPKNILLIVLDNGAYGTTGYQKSFSSGVTNLGYVARACGFERCYSASDEDKLAEAVSSGLTNNTLSFIHVIVKSNDVKSEPIPIKPIAIKNRFMEALKLC
jgi:sulfopyruvate decarboxylase beta subunit